MAIIVPAILEKDIQGFEDKSYVLTRLPEVSRIHVDFSDGKFVPNTTVAVDQIEPLNPAFEWEAHLMIEEPSDFLDYEIAGFKAVIVHFEAFPDKEKLKAALTEIKKLGMQAGLAINPETETKALEPYVELIDQITVMSVKPGFQGSPFEESALQKIAQLKASFSNVIIEIDGSVNENTIAKVVGVQPDLLVAGSAIVHAQNPHDAYLHLQQALK